MIDRSYVTLNVAMTADGKTDPVSRHGAAISSPLDRERVDRLRAASDAIMVGGRTITGDDRHLTVTSPALRAERSAGGLEENPVKVGVITNANLPSSSRFLTGGSARIIDFTTTQTDSAQVEWLMEQGVQVFVMGERRIDLKGDAVPERTGHPPAAGRRRGDAPTFANGAGLERQEAIPPRAYPPRKACRGWNCRLLYCKNRPSGIIRLTE